MQITTDSAKSELILDPYAQNHLGDEEMKRLMARCEHFIGFRESYGIIGCCKDRNTLILRFKNDRDVLVFRMRFL